MDCCWNLPVVWPPDNQAAALASTCLGGHLPPACAPLSDRAYHVASAGQPGCNGSRRVVSAGMMPNYAIERSENGRRVCAAGAPEIIAPAARGTGVPRSAHRGR